MDPRKLITNEDCERFARAWQMMLGASKITLLTHYNPDGDGVSACAALDHILRKLGKEVETIYPTPLKVAINRQPKKVLVNTHSQGPDLIVACDTANYERLYYPEQFHAIPLINIDHHVSSSINPTINLLDPVAPSTCDYLYRLLVSIDAALVDKFVAECLLYGILYDTQSFSIQSTSSQVLRVAADLIDRGVEYHPLAQELMYRKKPTEIKFWGSILTQMQSNAAGSVVWVVIKQKELKAVGLPTEVIAGLENLFAQLAVAGVTILFYEDSQGKSKASFRSKGVDVNVVAKKFGGGGHKLASGLMSDVSLDVLVPQIIACFE